jgi:PAS domain S-box-containing protein
MHNLPSGLIATALEDAPDAMLIADAEGRIRFANQNVTEVFGHARADLIGRSLEVLMPERFRAAHVARRIEFTCARKSRPMGGQRLDLFGLRADGSEFPVAISLKTIHCESEWFAVAAIRDMTNHMLAERELKEAREQAERANTSKSRFLATASHDLRQPLQTLALLNGALRRLDAGRPASMDALVQQEKAIASMSRLLNALLDISKLESGAVKPQPGDFSVNTLFHELREEFSGLAAAKGLSLEVTPCTEAAHSDPALVGQVLRNLVANAIKYTHEGSVEVRCLRDDPALVRIEVRDTGIGIPAGQLEHIFEEFFQVRGAHSPARDGYGLGLSIVQRLVALLNLKLDVRSELGRGSVFTLSLPASHGAASPAGPASAAAVEPHGPPGQARILLVEDDAGVRAATSFLLKSEGYGVTTAASLAEAVEHVRRDPRVDLLITDYHLGEAENGTQVIASLRRELGPRLKAVLMTGDTSAAMRALPPDPLMRIAAKPMNAEELLSLLRALLAE